MSSNTIMTMCGRTAGAAAAEVVAVDNATVMLSLEG